MIQYTDMKIQNGDIDNFQVTDAISSTALIIMMSNAISGTSQIDKYLHYSLIMTNLAVGSRNGRSIILPNNN